MTKADLLRAIENSPARSAWARGVREYAAFILEGLEDLPEDLGGFRDAAELEAFCLNGAADWRQYSEGGLGLVYDEAIARTLCTPSELRRVLTPAGGVKEPNRRETWINIEARALFQAWCLIAGLFRQ